MSAFKDANISRRDVLKTTAALSAAAAFAAMGTNFAHAAASDKLRVGLIGCGGRGSGAAGDCVGAAENVELVAMGDLFPDRLATAKENIAKKIGKKFAVKDEQCFTGFDAYQKVIASDVDLVILTTPPAFRPMHIRAAAEAGKHIFAEKPVAVDPAGVRSVIESAKIIKEKKLGFVAGTQRRHIKGYIETIKRIHDGDIGKVIGGTCYWNQGLVWHKGREPEWSELEWQLRNWNHFTWLGGDHIVEQHVHNIDVMNWAMNGPPISAYGMGGRQVRVGAENGNIYDHFAIEYVYANDARVISMCRQTDGTDGRIGEFIVGTKGRAEPREGIITGEKPFEVEEEIRMAQGMRQEHADLIASIRSGEPLNEAQRMAETTLTAIMGRMSAYTGKLVTWEQAMESKLDLMPTTLALGPMPAPPVAVPGKEPLI